MPEPVGIIGLGRIGLAAAQAYLAAGFPVLGNDRRVAAMEQLKAAGGIPFHTAEAVAQRARILLILVLNDEQVIEVLTGKDGVLRSASVDSTVVCMSTINRDTIAMAAAKCGEKKVRLIDCPFTGGPARVATRTLTLIAAGPEADLDAVRPVLEVLGNIVYAGAEPGLGQAVKHCNQLLVGATHAATMEVIALARRLGLDPSLVTSVVGSGIAGSDYFRLLAESVLKKTPSPGGLGQMCKDMAIVCNTLRNVGMQAHVGTSASEYFSTAERLGMTEREGADLIEVVEAFSSSDEAETESV